MTDTPDPLLSRIAREHLRIETLASRNRDSLDFHDLHVAGVRSALKAAYDAGVKAGIAREMGVTTVAHAEGAGRYPWRVQFQDGRCVMVSNDFSQCVASRSPRARDTAVETSVAVEEAPLELFHAVRTERGRARP